MDEHDTASGGSRRQKTLHERDGTNTRAYYREVWGFDPVRDRQRLHDGSDRPGREDPRARAGDGPYKYEAWFPLAADPSLHARGVQAGARVVVTPEPPIQNRIVFRIGPREAVVECVHLAVYAGPPREVATLSIHEIVERAASTEDRPVILPPEEHFVALKSYVGGIAAVGIGRLLGTRYHPTDPPGRPDPGAPEKSRASPEASRQGTGASPGLDPIVSGQLPFGFNHLMQAQVLRALLTVVPDAVWELLAPYLADTLQLDPWVTSALARHSKTLEAVLARLAASPDDDARRAVANNPRVPAPALHRLARDTYHWVRRAVAEHPNTAPDDLAWLAGDPDYWVRRAVAQSPRCPADAARQLRHDPESKIRHALRANPAVPDHLARSASEKTPPGPENRVSVPARDREAIASISTPARLAELATSENPWNRHAVALNPHSPPRALEALASDPNPMVRREVAEHPRVPSAILAWLGLDPVAGVRRAVAANPRAPPGTRRALLGDDDPEVRFIARGNPPRREPPRWKRFRRTNKTF